MQYGVRRILDAPPLPRDEGAGDDPDADPGG
jgi:hypothetical protein